MGFFSKAKRFVFSPRTNGKTSNGQQTPFDEFSFRSKIATNDSRFLYNGPDFGSTDETFFDSTAWLDSDCEDDFYSVNGDFTPSRGSTPNYQINTAVMSPLNKAVYLSTFPVTDSELSPTDGKKKLFDLLQETLPEHVGNELKAETNGKSGGNMIKTYQHPRSSEGTPYLSGTNSVCSSEMSPGRDSKYGEKRTRKTKACCFPSMLPSISFNARKRQNVSPTTQKMSPGY